MSLGFCNFAKFFVFSYRMGETFCCKKEGNTTSKRKKVNRTLT